MIPTNLKHEEVGALLIVVGRRMMDHDVTADVVLDLGTYSDPDETLTELIKEIKDEMIYDDVSDERAQLLLGITLAEAITFNEFDK